MASAEELAKLIESIVRAVLSGLQGAGGSVGGNPGNRRILDLKRSEQGRRFLWKREPKARMGISVQSSHQGNVK